MWSENGNQSCYMVVKHGRSQRPIKENWTVFNANAYDLDKDCWKRDRQGAGGVEEVDCGQGGGIRQGELGGQYDGLMRLLAQRAMMVMGMETLTFPLELDMAPWETVDTSSHSRNTN